MRRQLIFVWGEQQSCRAARRELPPPQNRNMLVRPAHVVDPRDAGPRDQFEAVALAIRDVLSQRWVRTQQAYDHWHYEHEAESRQALDLIFSGHFNRREPGLYEPNRETLLTRGDYSMHLADLASHTAAQTRVSALYADPGAWSRKAIFNVGGSGKFSSDRAVSEYAADIWGAEPCPVAEAR